MTKFFPPEFRTAGVVPRWSVVWTLTDDTVSNHSFFVTLYANQIARKIGWKGDYGQLLFTAIVHDLNESVSGDIVAPAKQAMVDTTRAQAYLREQMIRRMSTIVEQEDEIEAALSTAQLMEIHRIVKAADRLDALLFLVIERRMGNGVVGPLIPQVHAGLKQSWFLLPCEPSRLSELWKDVEAAIEEHATSGGFGV